MKFSKINHNTNYWAGNLTGSSDMWWRTDQEVKKGKDLIALSAYRRAISNFVNIVTKRTDIPVRFSSGSDSYTDGKAVTLSASMNDKNFDPMVGLALHEGSHIAHTDFEEITNLDKIVQEHYTTECMDENNGRRFFRESLESIKNLFNYIEDRRIDQLTFKDAPGYKGYYHSMYNKYFHFSIIDKALKSDEYRDVTWESYFFRIINFTNKNTDLNALPELRNIYRTINLQNISRLKTSRDAINVALEIFDIILPLLASDSENNEKESEDDTEYKQKDKSSNDEGEDNSQDEGEDNELENLDLPSLTPSQKKSLQNAVNKQKDFVNNKQKKTKLSQRDQGSLKATEESGAYTVKVGDESSFGTTNVVVVPKLTDSMIPESVNAKPIYSFIHAEGSRTWRWAGPKIEDILDGLRLGRVLGKKLQVRNEERTTKWSRQDSGRLDRRLIAELGFDNDRVFKTSFTEKYNEAYLHISIDASGSMSGAFFINAIKSAAAICQAASMVGNIHVQVSIRTTLEHMHDHKPVIAIIYDSKVNKIIHIKKFWKHLRATGTTPEGLCFESIMKDVLSNSNGRDAYFLNYSDGMPSYYNNTMRYGGDSARSHTASEVNKMKQAGIKILSFFITDRAEDANHYRLRHFKQMYGKDAITIDPTSIMSLAKVLNNKFLEK